MSTAFPTAQMCWLEQARPSIRWPIATKSHALAQINFGIPFFRFFFFCARTCEYDLFSGRYNLIYDAEPITKFCKITQQKVLKTIYPKTHQIEFVFLYVFFFLSLALELDSCYF